MKTEYRYQVGEVINESLEIVSQTRHGKQNRKAYEVQSLVYPDAPVYIVLESGLDRGQGCSYRTGKKIFEGNSLYSVNRIRPYLIDIEESKSIPPQSSKKIKVKCLNCQKIKYIRAGNLVNYGVSCTNCSRNISYPEKLFKAYLEIKNIKYEYQRVFKNLPNRRFDFYLPESNTVIETHGEQHYKNKSGSWDTTKTQESDKIKEQYCKDNNISYIVINCSKSNFNYIKDEINKTTMLPEIKKEDFKSILNIIEDINVYPTKKIIKKYKEGKSSYEVGKELGVSNDVVRRILRRHNIVVRTSGQSKSKKVKNLKTNKVYDSITRASKKTGESITKIHTHCVGKRSKQTTKWKYM